MLVEALVITACMNGSGCIESTMAYSSYNHEFQSMIMDIENKIDKISKSNTYMVYVVTPAYIVMSGKTAHFAIYKKLTFDVNIKNQYVGLNWSY